MELYLTENTIDAVLDFLESKKQQYIESCEQCLVLLTDERTDSNLKHSIRYDVNNFIEENYPENYI